MKNNIQDIMVWKYSGLDWQCGESYDSLEWRSEKIQKPTLKEIEEADIEYSKYIKSIKYINLRKKEYPTIEMQLDMLWHSMDSGEISKSKEFHDAIKLVKDRYPKP